jgi:hypothetical protein
LRARGGFKKLKSSLLSLVVARKGCISRRKDSRRKGGKGAVESEARLQKLKKRASKREGHWRRGVSPLQN